MGWGIDFKIDIFLDKLVIANKEELLELIQEKEKDVTIYQKQLMMYVSSNPKDVVPNDWKEEPIRFLQMEIDSLFEEYNEQIKILKDLNYYKKYLES